MKEGGDVEELGALDDSNDVEDVKDVKRVQYGDDMKEM